MAIKTPRSRALNFLPAGLAATTLAATTLAATTLAASFAGCGGGGGGDSGGVGASLAFKVAWEQPRPAPGSASSVAALGPDGAAASFDTPIPPSVSAIRFILSPDSGSPCCIAVLRGSEAFEQRSILLADVTPGTGTLVVNGFPTDFAPNGGVTAACQTRSAGEGSACSSQDTLPSFGSDEIELDLAAGVTNVVNVDVHSLPFVINLDPEDGGTADDPRPFVNFAVVDANHPVSSAIDVLIDAGVLDVEADILSQEACEDNQPSQADPPCSEGEALDVRGRIVSARSPQVLPPGVVDLRILAQNNAPIPRSMESNTTFIVPGDVTTTVTDTSTSTLPTTTDTSTTTTLPPETFCLEFSVGGQVDLVGLSYTVSYGAAGGEFTGSGEDVSCITLLDPGSDTTFTTFNDEDATSTLLSAVISAEPFSVPIALARCEFVKFPPLNLADFTIQVTEATGADLSSVFATVGVTESTCPF